MQRLSFATALASFLMPATVLAVQGEQPYRHAPDQRAARVAHAAVQAQLDGHPAWQDFLARHGQRWDARWDEATGQAVRIWGEGWAVDADALTDDDAARQLGWQVLTQEAELLGISLQDLVPGVVAQVGGTTAVTFTQTYASLPVVDSRISLRFKAGRFVVGQFESFPGIALDVRPVVAADDAAKAATDALGWPSGEAGEATLVVLPLATAKSVDYRLAWQVDVTKITGPGHRTVWVDAADASLLRWDEHVRFLSGTVELDHDDRWPQNGRTTTPMIGGSLTGPAGTLNVATDGSFTGPGSAPADVAWTVDSDVVNITSTAEPIYTFNDSIGGEGGTLVGSPGNNLGNAATRRVLAQAQAHQATHIARQLSLDLNPGFGWAQQQVVVRVNLDDTQCNAWFDEQSTINFVVQGGGCNNTGRLADVIYHEYGHGFHGWNIVQGAGAFDGALSEGLADYMSATITDDNGMGRGFFTNSSAPLRDIGPDRSWPQDQDGDPHITGLIIAGALWDLRVELEAALGQAGILRADEIFLATASFASDIPDGYVEALLADDDDGNLANGTPNRCIIDETYARHGLADGDGAGAASFFAEHTPLGVGLPTQTDLAIEVTTGLSNPECADGVIESAVLSWDAGDGNLSDLDMTANGDVWTASIPGQAPGTFVRYRIDVYNDAGDVVTALPRGSITDSWFGAWVGDREILWGNDFESDDGGMTSDLLVGDPTTLGANDWMWEAPKGSGGDPDGAFSGNLAWGNDLTPEPNWNGEYQASIHNLVRTPLIEVGDEAPVLLQFRRWLTVEDGVFDQARVEVNGQVIWSNLQGDDNDHHIDSHWAFRSYDITDLITSEGLVEVTWELVSDGGLQFGGWTIDDVEIVVPSEDQVDPGDDDDATSDDDDAADDDDATGDDDDNGDDDDVVSGPPGGLSGEGAGCDCNAAGNSGGGLGLLGLLGLAVRRRR